MKIIFTPAIQLMLRLRYPYKLGLVSLFFVLPIVVLVVMLVNETSANIDFARKEQEGVDYIAPLRQLLEHTQQHRGMANAMLAGDASFAPKLDDKQKTIAELLAKAHAADKRHLGLGLTEKLNNLDSEWQLITAKVKQLTPRESFATHTAYIAKLMAFFTDVADASNLTLDPNLDTYYAMDAVVVRMPALTESLGQARALGTAMAARKSATVEERAKLSGLHSMVNTMLEGANRGIDVAMRSNADLKKHAQELTIGNNMAVKAFLGTLDAEFIQTDAPSVSAKPYFDAATATINKVYQLNDVLLPELERMLVERVNTLVWKRTSMLIFVTGVLLLVGYLYLSFYLSVIQVVRSLEAASHDMADGDLGVCADANGRDELARVASSFNIMSSKLQTVVMQVRGAANELASLSQQISITAQSISHANSEQAASVEETSASVEQMSASINQNTDNAKVTDGMASQAAKQAVDGGAAVKETVAAMKQIAGKIGISLPDQPAGAERCH